MSATVPPTPPERRTRARVFCELAAVITCDSGLMLPGKTVELSEIGVRVRLDAPLRNHREHTIQRVEIDEIGVLSVDLRWVAGADVGLALIGDWIEREMLTMYLSHLEGQARAAEAARSRSGQA